MHKQSMYERGLSMLLQGEGGSLAILPAGWKKSKLVTKLLRFLSLSAAWISAFFCFCLNTAERMNTRTALHQLAQVVMDCIAKNS